MCPHDTEMANKLQSEVGQCSVLDTSCVLPPISHLFHLTYCCGDKLHAVFGSIARIQHPESLSPPMTLKLRGKTMFQDMDIGFPSSCSKGQVTSPRKVRT